MQSKDAMITVLFIFYYFMSGLKLRWLFFAWIAFCCSGCVADQRNTKTGKQELSLTGIAWERPNEEPKPAPVPKAEVSASNNDTQQSQSGVVNLALAKFAETIKPEISAIRGDVTGIKSEVKSEMQFQFKQQNEANVKALSDFEVKVNQKVEAAINQKLEAFKNASMETQAGYKNQIDKIQQELHGNNNTVITNDRQALKDGYEAHQSTIERFVWLMAQCFTAFCLLLRFGFKQLVVLLQYIFKLSSQEEMALIESKKKTEVMQRGKHAE